MATMMRAQWPLDFQAYEAVMWRDYPAHVVPVEVKQIQTGCVPIVFDCNLLERRIYWVPAEDLLHHSEYLSTREL